MIFATPTTKRSGAAGDLLNGSPLRLKSIGTHPNRSFGLSRYGVLVCEMRGLALLTVLLVSPLAWGRTSWKHEVNFAANPWRQHLNIHDDVAFSHCNRGVTIRFTHAAWSDNVALAATSRAHLALGATMPAIHHRLHAGDIVFEQNRKLLDRTHSTQQTLQRTNKQTKSRKVETTL